MTSSANQRLSRYAPFDKLVLVKRYPNRRGAYIGGHSKDGILFEGFAEVDPISRIWSRHEAEEVATALIACWNACSDAGLTVEQLEAGAIKQAIRAQATQADASLRRTAQNMVDTADDLTAALRSNCSDCVIYNDDNGADVGSLAASVDFAGQAVTEALFPQTTTEETTNG
jgi:hypothetical protein